MEKEMQMKLLPHICIIVFAMIALSGCSNTDHSKSPAGYVRHCLRLMNQRGLYSDTEVWKATNDSVLRLSKNIETYEEAHAVIKDIVNVAGGKHSFLKPPIEDTSSYEEHMPEILFPEDSILCICLPAHAGVVVSDSAYVNTVLTALKECSNSVKGVVVDLRENHGGNMYPMIAAVSPLIRDGIVLKFKSTGKHVRVEPISLDFVLKSQHVSSDFTFKISDSIPIAIMTDEMTASSGEAALLTFRGMENVRTFGTPTAGYASANTSYVLSDGYTLVLTVGKEVARTGEVFCDDPIEPDVFTEQALEDAILWIRTVGR